MMVILFCAGIVLCGVKFDILTICMIVIITPQENTTLNVIR